MAGSPRSAADVFSPREKVALILLYLGIAAVTVAGFVALYLVSRSYDHPAGAGTAAVEFGALGVAAYVFGLRHGVDADHIAAIDNTTRKLLQEGKRPLTVGTWFSLGHSTIVVGLIVLVVASTRWVAQSLPVLRASGTIVGTVVSGTFLYLIGVINVIIVLEVYRIFRGLQHGRFSEAQLEEQLANRGFMNRYFGRLFRVVTTPRQIYPIGVLFGLGFDTASEIALIGISVVVAFTVPIWAVLILPLLFTAGMVLVDTTDAITMRFAYGWAFLKPIRKIYYNLTVTIISVLVAFAIGSVELLQVLAGELGWSGAFWRAFEQLDFESLGIAIVVLFVATWGIASLYYRYRRFDEIPFGTAVSPAPSE